MLNYLNGPKSINLITENKKIMHINNGKMIKDY